MIINYNLNNKNKQDLINFKSIALTYLLLTQTSPSC